MGNASPNHNRNSKIYKPYILLYSYFGPFGKDIRKRGLRCKPCCSVFDSDLCALGGFKSYLKDHGT